MLSCKLGVLDRHRYCSGIDEYAMEFHGQLPTPTANFEDDAMLQHTLARQCQSPYEQSYCYMHASVLARALIQPAFKLHIPSGTRREQLTNGVEAPEPMLSNETRISGLLKRAEALASHPRGVRRWR